MYIEISVSVHLENISSKSYVRFGTFLVRFGEFGRSGTGQLHRVRPPPAQ